MVSDLHHLYASLDSCNNFRSNYIFGDYFDNKDQRAQKLEKPGCGITFSQNASDQRNPSVVGFEAYAKEGRGATARSTLYFFVRYPGVSHFFDQFFIIKQNTLILKQKLDYQKITHS